jgi:flagellar biosynthesis chaperone FliJ
MRPFRFRAQAALQLRRREHEQALAALARRQTALTAAQNLVEVADGAIRESETRMAETLKTPTARGQLDWYRSWRVRCRAERDRSEQQRQGREAELLEANRVVSSTYQRVRSLERLHDHALAAWRKAADQEEMKTMDALATMRFTRRKDDV